MPVILDTETAPTPMPVVFDLTITAAGPYSYTVPAGSTTADVELWGAGGGGGGIAATRGSGGGGGGAQTSAPGIATTPHALVSGTIGTGGAAGAAGLPGGDGSGTNYINSATAFADFGLGGDPGNGAQGAGGARGAAAHCVPAGRNGGNGGGSDAASVDGGGGGGSAGTTGAAGAGNSNGTAGTAGTGGGAAGGTGAAGAVAATAASSPGGGGGGASTLAAASAGKNGRAQVVSNNARWDAILSGSAPGQTFSIFVDTGAAPDVEVRSDESYDGNLAAWVPLVGNLGVKVFGVQDEATVEAAINVYSGLATVTTPGTTPTATFSDTPLAGISAPFLTAANIDAAIAATAVDVATVSYIAPPQSLFVQMSAWIAGMFSQATGIFPPSDDDGVPGQRVVTDWFATHLLARAEIEGPLAGDAGVVGTSAVINAVVRVLYAVKYGVINGDITSGQQNAVVALYNLVWE